MRTDGVHCRESADTGAVNIKANRVLPWQVTMDQLVCASLSHSHYRHEVSMLEVSVTLYTNIRACIHDVRKINIGK